MADENEITLPEPKRGELTQPQDHQLMLAGPYAGLMIPDDAILMHRGGDYTLYRETLRDDACAAPFAQRRLAVTQCEWAVDPGGTDALSKNAAAWMREQLQQLEWDRITDKMLYANWYGHAIGECIYAPNNLEGKVVLDDIRVRDRGRFMYPKDRSKEPFVWDQATTTWKELPPRKMWHLATGADHDDAPYGLGLAHQCYWPVFFKRNNIKFWLVFLEKFASPTAVGKMPPGQFDKPGEKAKVLQALRALASETAVVFPDGTDVELLQATRSGTQDYDTMRKAMDDAMQKLIIGQTASSQGTPGKLGNEDLQAQVRKDIVKADADLVCQSFSRSVGTWLTQWNFPGAKVPRVWRVTEESEDLNTRAERDAKIFGLGYEPTEKYVTDTYGEGWQKKAVQQFGTTPEEITARALAEFAELGAIVTARNGHRLDEAAIVRAADTLAAMFPDTIGPRVEQILSYADETQDYATMGEHLLELMRSAVPGTLPQSVGRATFLSRMMGRLRGQR